MSIPYIMVRFLIYCQVTSLLLFGFTGRLLHLPIDDSVAKQPTATLQAAIPTRNKYLYRLQMFVQSPGVCGLYACKRSHDTGFITTEGATKKTVFLFNSRFII